MTHMDYEKTAANLTPRQFELLLRAYCRQQVARATERTKTCTVTFAASFDRQDILENARWTVCFGWGSDTKGEILHGAMTEAMRREGWARTPEAVLTQLTDGRAERTED